MSKLHQKSLSSEADILIFLNMSSQNSIGLTFIKKLLEFGECINRIAPPSPARALTLKTSTRMKTRIFYETIKLFYPIVNNTFTVTMRERFIETDRGNPIVNNLILNNL